MREMSCRRSHSLIAAELEFKHNLSAPKASVTEHCKLSLCQTQHLPMSLQCVCIYITKEDALEISALISLCYKRENKGRGGIDRFLHSHSGKEQELRPGFSSNALSQPLFYLPIHCNSVYMRMCVYVCCVGAHVFHVCVQEPSYS